MKHSHPDFRRPYIPDPEVGTVWMDEDGERWKVLYADFFILRSMPLDFPDGPHRLFNRGTWDDGFLRKGWLTI
jgi:hypothetical protein